MNYIIHGRAGDDQISGAYDKDRPFGDAANDTTNGGAGADYFIFETALNAEHDRLPP